MTTPTFRRPLPPDRLARRPAVRPGVTLLATGLLAVLGGGVLLLIGLLLPQMTGDPQMQQMIADLRQNVAVEPATVLITTGGLLAAYGIAALVLGIGLLAGVPAWRSAALSFCCAVAGLLALMTLSAAVTGNAGALLEGVVLIGPHAFVIWWLIGTPTAATAAAPAIPADWPLPSPRWPMQDYYTPPVPPQTRGE